MNKKAISFVLSSTMVFASAASAFAATGDVLNLDKTLFASGKQMNTSQALQKQVNAQQSKHLYEFDGKYYHMADANDAYAKAGSMDNFASEIAKKTPVDDVTEDLAISSIKVVTSTKIIVQLSKAVDNATVENFAVAGVTINSATLSDDHKTVTLAVEGVEPKASYKLAATGLKINSEVQPAVEKEFTVPSIDELFKPELTFADEDGMLKADGADATLVTFSLKDAEGKVITDAQDVEISFTTTLGTFGEDRVSVQNGVANVLLTSEFLTAARTAELRGTVVNAKDQSLIGLYADTKIKMDPNPETDGKENVGASMTDAEANQADRVIVYFNKAVNAADYMDQAGVDATKALIEVRETATSATEGTPVVVKGLLPVAGNDKALQVLLDVEASDANALTDNSDVWVRFVDKTGDIDVDKNLTFKNTDGRAPSMLSVDRQGLNCINVIFSESIEKASGSNKANWQIDGVSLDNYAKWGDATITVGEYTVANAQDRRSVVTIKLGTGKYFTTGSHSIQAANVGDWASLSDPNNKINTQTLDFIIPEDNEVPVASVTVQSPEQYLITYSKDVLESAADFATKLTLEKYNTTTSLWETASVAAISATATLDNNQLDLVVTKLDDNKFLVETDYDWTNVYDTKTTLKNYYSDLYRLVVDEKAVTNPANGKQNVKQELALNGPMLNADLVSPVIEKIEQVENSGVYSYIATMSEPVKLNATANAEGATDSQKQGYVTKDKWDNIPVPQAKFINQTTKTEIQGTIAASFNDQYEMELIATPDTPLEPGIWTLAVLSISDDVGNTAATAAKDFEVKGATPDAEKFAIEFAYADVDRDAVVEAQDADDKDDLYDYVFIKFNQAFAKSGDVSNALKTSNYTFNAVPLPKGTQIFAGINGAMTDEAVTIRMPQGTLNGKNAPHNINVSKFLQSAKGEALTNGGEKTLPCSIDTVDVPAILQAQLAYDMEAKGLTTKVITAASITLPADVSGTAITWADSTTVDGAKVAQDGTVTHSNTDNVNDTVAIKATFGEVVMTFELTIAETKAPTMTACVTSGAVTVAAITFDEKMDKATVENTSNWTAGGSATVDSIVLQDDGTTVLVTFSSLPDSGTIATKSDIKDANGNAANVNTATYTEATTTWDIS